MSGELNVLFIAIGGINRASSRLRVHCWVPFLEQEGIECRVITYFRPVVTDKLPLLAASASALYRRGLIHTSISREILRSARNADVIFVQEALLPRWVLRALRQTGKRFIFDFSDPIHLTSGNQHRFYHRLVNKWFGQNSFRETLKLASCVIVENDRLVKVVEDKDTPVYVIRGPIDTNFFMPCAEAPKRDRVVLGWTGSPLTYPYLEPLLPTIARLGEEYPHLELHLIGAPCTPKVGNVLVKNIAWQRDTEPQQVGEFDLALSYLPESTWTRARGGGKLFVYMAAGVPIVSSYFGIGDQVIRHGENGLLAKTNDDWYVALKSLITDANLRRRLGDNAREEAVKFYSYQAYLPLMVSLIRGKMTTRLLP
jgi:glycosyltransferase involved in cell wall biosynthesis